MPAKEHYFRQLVVCLAIGTVAGTLWLTDRATGTTSDFTGGPQGQWVEVMRNILVLAVSVVAVITDWKRRKIPNLLTFPAMGVGLLLGLVEGLVPFTRSVGGLLMALGIAFPFFGLNLIGAGDVKLLMAYGAIKGVASPAVASFPLWTFLYGALFGGLLSLIFYGWSAGQRVVSVARIWALTGPKPVNGSETKEKGTVPYAMALAMGAFLALLLELQTGSSAPWL